MSPEKKLCVGRAIATQLCALIAGYDRGLIADTQILLCELEEREIYMRFNFILIYINIICCRNLKNGSKK